MKRLAQFLVLGGLYMFSQLAVADPTGARKINAMDLQGADGTILLRANGGWGATCNGVAVDTIYFTKTSVSAYKEMLAMVTSAYLSGKYVRYYGGCVAGMPNNYFSGTYLIVSDQ